MKINCSSNRLPARNVHMQKHITSFLKHPRGHFSLEMYSLYIVYMCVKCAVACLCVSLIYFVFE